jgi:hypothetical protein
MKKNITLREVDLQTSDGTVTLKGDVKEDLKHAHFYYNSITPDTTPCKSIAAIGELAG